MGLAVSKCVSRPVRTLQWTAFVAGAVCLAAGLAYGRWGEESCAMLAGFAALVGSVGVLVAVFSSSALRLPLLGGLGMMAGLMSITSMGVQLAMGLLYLAIVLRAVGRVRRERGLDPNMRRRQLRLAWCLPVFGPLLVTAHYAAEDDPYVDDGVASAPECIHV